MNAADKRQLLADIDMLVKRPAQIDFETIPRVIQNMNHLMVDLFGTDEFQIALIRKKEQGE